MRSPASSGASTTSMPKLAGLAASSGELRARRPPAPSGQHRGRIAGARADDERALSVLRHHLREQLRRAPPEPAGSGLPERQGTIDISERTTSRPARTARAATAPMASSHRRIGRRPAAAAGFRPSRRAPPRNRESGFGPSLLLYAANTPEVQGAHIGTLDAAPTAIDRKTRRSAWVDARRLTARRRRRGKGVGLSSGPDGGVVTQRTANPCTPVQFRLGPPPTFKRLILHDNAAVEWRNCGTFSAPILLRRLRLRRAIAVQNTVSS